MKREFLLNIFFLITINLLVKPFYIFGIDLTIQNRVGYEQYGWYAALFNFTFIFQIINDFGLQQFNSRNIARHRQLLPRYFPNMLMLKAGFGLVYILVVLVIAMLLGYQPNDYRIIPLLMMNHILVSLIAFFRSNISGLGFYRTDSVVTVIDRLLLILICGILLWANPFRQPFQIEWFIYAQTVSLLITAVIAFWLICQHLPSLQIRFKPAFFWLMLRKSYPYALAIFLMGVYTRLDFVMIERLLSDGDYEAGIYASGYRLLDAANVLGLLFAGLLLPMTARLLKEKKSINALLSVSLRLILCLAIITAISVFFFRVEIIELLYKNASVAAANTLGVLMLTFIAGSGIYIFGTILTANDSLKILNKVFAICVLLNIILNYFLIPRYGAFGAAMATLFTQSFAFFNQIFIAQKEFLLDTNWKLIAQLTGFVVSIILVNYTLRLIPVHWTVQFLTGGGIALLLGIPFELLPFREFSNQLGNRATPA